MKFRVKRASKITDASIRASVSAGGALAPREVRYSFRLTPEDCSIGIWAYNQETVLAEKLETVGSRAAGLSWHTVMDSIRGLYGPAQG